MADTRVPTNKFDYSTLDECTTLLEIWPMATDEVRVFGVYRIVMKLKLNQPLRESMKALDYEFNVFYTHANAPRDRDTNLMQSLKVTPGSEPGTVTLVTDNHITNKDVDVTPELRAIQRTLTYIKYVNTIRQTDVL
eukprot:Phypoly_transcript_25031.p1 GENE.Phypoly_transcript_25031~~Phypoly_transcript_25031.p1  ORF type:complete len:136 (+),score=23.99 Phypoly_transcript_25031:95-502(+)